MKYEKYFWLYLKYRRKIIGRISNNKMWRYAIDKKKILPIDDTSKLIQQLLNCDEPCMIARFGANEMRIVSEYHQVEFGMKKHISKDSINQLCNGAGFFPSDEQLIRKFAEEMISATKELDVLGVWNVNMEEYAILKYALNTQITKLENLEPWYLPLQPWSGALKGKKVLVIHPFADTIEQQYKKRSQIFPNTNILPEFELITLRAVQTIAGQRDSRFNTWFDALYYMEQEALKLDFDVAILGCGAYGFPLAARLKKAGKKTIHLGGATQIFFGIKGKRWDDIPFFSEMYNDAWARPLSDETPIKAKSVEDGCYW